MKQNAGLTLMELLITTFMLSVGVLAAIGSYQYISTSIQHSKGRTLASNLAQEQIEKLKNLSYYTLLVTTSTHDDTNFSPSLVYDEGNYPPQTIVEGGINFTRATRVDFAFQNGTKISTVPYTTDDTALKQISVFVMWQEHGLWKSQSIQSLFANPAAVPLNAAAQGKVVKALGGNLSGAYVQVIDNANWYGVTDASGDYRFSVSEGSYTIQASSTGYYTATTSGYQSFTSGNTTTVNFTMTAIAFGTVTGYAYKNDNLVISQVVASSQAPSGFDQEWVEIYNPSTFTWTIATGPGAPVFDLYYDRHADAMHLLDVTYYQLTIPSHAYYIFANTTTIVVNGVSVNVDAEYLGSLVDYPNVMKTFEEVGVQNSGGVRLVRRTTGETIDEVGWSSNLGGLTPGFYEGLPLDENQGINMGEQYIRFTGPGAMNSTHGSAYDSHHNRTNFDIYTGASLVSPKNSAMFRHPVSGTPLNGAAVRMNDLLNNMDTCDATVLGGLYSVCSYSLVAATGTWTLEISSGNRYAQIQTVRIDPSVSTGVPNGATLPTWAAVSTNTVTLVNDTTTFAFVSGTVLNGAGAPINGIRISDGNGRSATTNSSGRYSLLATTGVITLVANPNDGMKNRTYSTQDRTAEFFQEATLYSNRDFTLELSGILRGFFRTSSNTPLPGRIGRGVKSTGSDSTEGSSDVTGYFYLQNLATGTYTVSPLLDNMESATPASYTVNMLSTGTFATVSTFTITSGIAEITGQVLIGASSTSIKTGTLVVASTATIASALPPNQLGATGVTCSPCYYSSSSDATGRYSLYVRSSTQPYKVYGWYSTISGNTAVNTKVGPYSVNVSTPGQILSQTLTW